jgi:hypothetical protein
MAQRKHRRILQGVFSKINQCPYRTIKKISVFRQYKEFLSFCLGANTMPQKVINEDID